MSFMLAAMEINIERARSSKKSESDFFYNRFENVELNPFQITNLWAVDYFL